MSDLVEGYEAALFDLDGVVYLGPEAVPGAAEGIDELRARGTQIGYVTNNAGRRPEVVVEHLNSLGVSASLADVVTSAQASAKMLADELPAGAKVLICGAQALADEVESVGLVPVWELDDEPAAVVQGYDPQMSWPRLDAAGHAIQRGALWFATNTDSTRPTNLGLVPGAGTQIDAIRHVVSVSPKVAGKPYPPLLEETMRRMDTQKCIFVGDRIDTDITGAVAVGIDSLMVFTGAHGVRDLLLADEASRPTAIGWDLRALLEPVREVEISDTSASCREQRAELVDDKVVLVTSPVGREAQLDALWAVLQLVWAGNAWDEAIPAQLDELH